eukprot:7620444-Alexandrium_andersonii.AAC.1
MSASLVGSEMCIRDSKANASFATLTELKPTLHSCHIPDHSKLRMIDALVCLLYTSDAADDM